MTHSRFSPVLMMALLVAMADSSLMRSATHGSSFSHLRAVWG